MTLTKMFHHTKLADLMDEMPGPSQQGASGAGPGALDCSIQTQNVNDGQSLSALEKLFPWSLGPKLKRRIQVPKKEARSMITFEDLLRESDELKELLEQLISASGNEKVDEGVDTQFRTFPRPNFSL